MSTRPQCDEDGQPCRKILRSVSEQAPTDSMEDARLHISARRGIHRVGASWGYSVGKSTLRPAPADRSKMAVLDGDAPAIDTASTKSSDDAAEAPAEQTETVEDKPKEAAEEPQKDAEEPSEEKPKSKYSRAKKSQERANKSWKEIMKRSKPFFQIFKLFRF